MTDNRIQHEINHGKFLAETGAGEIWNWNTPAGLYRWKRRVEMLTHNIQKEMNVLELGCGTGYFSKELVKTNAKITAIDISPDLIEIAKNETKKFSNIEYLLQNAYSMDFENECFDIVVGSSVLHHLDVEKALSETYRVLKKNGTIRFTEPNMLNPQIALHKNIPYIKKKLGDSPDETAFFRTQLKRLLKKHGFSDIKIINFDFLHPAVPKSMIKFINSAGAILESTPLIKEISGSLYIQAKK